MRWLRLSLQVFLAWLSAWPALAGELRVLSTPTLKSAVEALVPEFERSTGLRVQTRFDAVAVLKRAIDAGEAFDVAILLPTTVAELVRVGRVGDTLHADIARALTGVAVRAGAPRPPLATVEDVKRALLAAPRIATSPESNASAGFKKLLDRLGIAEQVLPKLVPVSGRSPVSAVASGEADMTVITVPNIIGVAGVDLAGLLPSELQTPTTFSVGIAATTPLRNAALTFARLLISPTGAAALRASGLEAIPGTSSLVPSP